MLPCAHAPASCTEHSLGRIQHKRHINTIIPAIITRLFSFQSSKFATINQTCHLLSLPIELLQEIALYLTLPDRIAITLTCKALYSALGTSLFSGIKELNEKESLDLLIPLQRDKPDYRICGPCKILHSPSRSTITLPRNRLRREKFPPTLQVYLIAPGGRHDRHPSFLYWLSDEHIRRVISHQICISTLRCSGTFPLSETLPSVPALHDTTFTYMMLPNRSRRNLIFLGIYEISFSSAPRLHWSQSYVRELLQNFDIRCCLHCSTELMLDEMVCVLFHGQEPSGSAGRGSSEGCTRTRDDPFLDGCGHHFHACECATEYSIEGVVRRPGDAAMFMRVFVWQWLGGRKDDVVLRERGILRHLHEDAGWD